MYQKTIIIGRLGAEPSMRYTPDGKPVCSFSVATGRNWTDANGVKKEKTVWFRVSVWNKMGEACQTYLHKGSLCSVDGELSEPNVYQAKSGEWKSSLELTARGVTFLGSKGESVADETVEEIEETPF